MSKGYHGLHGKLQAFFGLMGVLSCLLDVHDHQSPAVFVLERVLEESGQLALPVGWSILGLELAIAQDAEDATKCREVLVDELALSLEVKPLGGTALAHSHRLHLLVLFKLRVA